MSDIVCHPPHCSPGRAGPRDDLAWAGRGHGDDLEGAGPRDNLAWEGPRADLEGEGPRGDLEGEEPTSRGRGGATGTTSRGRGGATGPTSRGRAQPYGGGADLTGARPTSRGRGRPHGGGADLTGAGPTSRGRGRFCHREEGSEPKPDRIFFHILAYHNWYACLT
ncbi:hypothetical protein NHX12_032029 [Muraenolepis orangiensis]|uniref:Uncharacterized protein n=1 Tax=Muraenolepis orangiensis TaxID=630683 RepID=A0A9Q0E6D3_9TELE|nr:hypothetical protein NHX12_032029 [Muraenolepis orangiensis]